MHPLSTAALLYDRGRDVAYRLWVAARKPCLQLLLYFLLYYCCFCAGAVAQDYNYRNYDVQHGLAGSTVYNMYQDTEGFIWFATETGVSRFDGTHFKNFTVKDGLPDNTIVRIFEDSRGRIWLAPFTNSICYYYKGKIYTSQNTPLLKRIVLDDYVGPLFENKKGEVIVYDGSHIYRIDINDSLHLIPYAAGFPPRSLIKVSESSSGGYFAMYTHNLYKTNTQSYTFLANLATSYGGVDNTIFTDKWWCWQRTRDSLHVQSAFYHLNYNMAVPSVNSLYCVNDSIICINTAKGTYLLNLMQGKVEKRYLPNKNISRFLMDKDGGLWFSTFNDGVYYLSSTAFRNMQYEVAKGQNLGVHDLEIGPEGIWAASDMGYLQWLRRDSLQALWLSKAFKQAFQGSAYCIARKNNVMAVGVEFYVFLFDGFSPIKKVTGINTVKDLAFINDQELMVAGSNSLYSLRLDNDTFERYWMGRTTSLLYRNDSTWFGASDGLYLLKPDKSIFYFGSISPLLKNRIAAIKEGADGTIWIATYSKGLVGLRNNQVKYHITVEDGLSNDASRCLAMDGKYIWAGTANGLNRIRVDAGLARVDNFLADGVASDMINAVLVVGDTVYAGTPQGITVFDKNNALPASVCDLKMLGISLNGKETALTDNIQLDYGNNNIRLNFVAISFSSAGNVVYNYRLKNLDTTWKTTSQTSLEFVSLPPGQHELEIYATNKFGINSSIHRQLFSILPPFWQTAWFVISCIITIVTATWLVVAYRNRQARKKEAARLVVEKQLHELEQKALRSQMNPHFIFNCMNSVQEFIIDKDIASANKYLTKFASLIRQTLDNSFHSSTTLASEIQYLTTYLGLEQMRHKNMFSYSLQISPELQPELVTLPVMLLQPYVENATWHGMRSGDNPDGQIDIHFSTTNNVLYCTITDNGIGREAALVAKKDSQVQYQSRGMQLTNERINLINSHAGVAITIDIKDLRDEAGNAAGTAVTIGIPFTSNRHETS
ncbi:sensor histidine kinase [Paraflavitalea soli]|nr:two-component regulator propeller domain-containing protein [Paraflavitalea soli]